MKKAAKIVLLVVLTLLLIWLSGRYCWQIFGFSLCESAGIEQVDVEEGRVRIRGFDPGSFPRGFLGCHTEQEGSTLYVGFKFSALFGIFETGDFDVTLPTKGTVTQVIIRTSKNEYPIWPEEAQEEPELPEASDAWEITEEPETSEIPTETEAKAEEPAVPTAYEKILDQYRTALEENWGGQQLLDEGMNFMILDVAPEEIGFAVDDLDDNGIPELAIGTLSGDEFYGKLIFELYTLENGRPLQVFSSIHRNRYYYAGGIRFANLGSSAADSSYVTTLKLEDGELVDMTYTTDPADYVQMQLAPVGKEHK